MTSFVWTIAGLYTGQLFLKAALALRYGRSLPAPNTKVHHSNATLLQAILSGDSMLPTVLEANLLALPECKHLWLVDTDDPNGREICEALKKARPALFIRIVEVPPPPQGINPKAYKLAHAASLVETEYCVVVDDDTRMTASGMNALLGGLEDGAMLATGLPSYISARGLFSGVLAEFVNSSAILTYLPVLALHPPITINGMCYAIRSRDVRRLDLFKQIERSLTDDLAVAQVVRRDGGRIFQSVQPQLISTTVSSTSALLRILHRWFVFTRLLVQGESITTKLMLVGAYGAPPLLLWLLLVTTLQSAVFVPLALTLVLRVAVLVVLQRRFYGRFTHRPFSSLLMEMAQPLFLASGYAKRTIVWRKRRIEVRTVDDFRYV